MRSEQAAFLFSTPEMMETFSLTEQLRAMMRFEWALVCALEKAGLAEAGSGAMLQSRLGAEFIDVEALRLASLEAGNIAIPFVQQLTAHVTRQSEAGARAIHLGATSQDVLDTALVLQMRQALRIILETIDRLDNELARLVRLHAETALTGRTWLQPGPPTTLGLKLAGTLAALRRHRIRIEAASERALVLQFGGAVGTLAALGSAGPGVSAEISRILDLPEPPLPWHTQRDNLAEIAGALALLVGTLGKFAKDIALLMQQEVGEASEPASEGRGGSSTMPQKQNPVACATILASAVRTPGLVATMLSAMPQEHERGLGLWQAEWETLPEIFRLTSVALSRSVELAEGLVVDTARMDSNLNSTLGLNQSEAVSVALASTLGRAAAHEIVREAALQAKAKNQHLSTVLKGIPEVAVHLVPEAIDRLLQPREYLGSTHLFIKRVLGDLDADS
jgi:3-carboxy-cis,cis-muconate cycloisomerase